MNTWLTKDEILNIPQEDLPLLVLSDNVRSFWSYAIKAHQRGSYNHLTWMASPGFLISQDWILHRVPVDKYLDGGHRLKFWTGKNWSAEGKAALCDHLNSQPDWPILKRLYDPIQILGIFIGLRWLQIPGFPICSDHADLIHMVDPAWQHRQHLSPPEVNRLLKQSANGRVYGRFTVD